MSDEVSTISVNVRELRRYETRAADRVQPPSRIVDRQRAAYWTGVAVVGIASVPTRGVAVEDGAARVGREVARAGAARRSPGPPSPQYERTGVAVDAVAGAAAVPTRRPRRAVRAQRHRVAALHRRRRSLQVGADEPLRAAGRRLAEVGQRRRRSRRSRSSTSRSPAPLLIARSEPMADASLPDMRARSRPGTAIAAMMPMIATTISSSISVKPLASTNLHAVISLKASTGADVNASLTPSRATAMPALASLRLRRLTTDSRLVWITRSRSGWHSTV